MPITANGTPKLASVSQNAAMAELMSVIPSSGRHSRPVNHESAWRPAVSSSPPSVPRAQQDEKQTCPPDHVRLP
ncbi:hypothetical protein GCM10010402_82010 [Actinomadura luteofluorescens]